MRQVVASGRGGEAERRGTARRLTVGAGTASGQLGDGDDGNGDEEQGVRRRRTRFGETAKCGLIYTEHWSWFVTATGTNATLFVPVCASNRD